jgi:hypothetical protein
VQVFICVPARLCTGAAVERLHLDTQACMHAQQLLPHAQAHVASVQVLSVMVAFALSAAQARALEGDSEEEDEARTSSF